MRVLVTGGAGFIGSHIVEHFQGKADVRVLESNDSWFGVTYPEDKADVVASIRRWGVRDQSQYWASIPSIALSRPKISKAAKKLHTRRKRRKQKQAEKGGREK